MKRIPDLRFSEFDGEWVASKLGDTTDKIQDGTHFSPIQYESGNFKYITSRNIRNGYMNLCDVPYLSDKAHREIYKRCDVQHNDVLLTKDGANTGNVCLNELEEEFSLLSSVAFIRANKNKATNEYIYQYICCPKGQREIRSTIAGQAITRITLTKLRNYKFHYPTLPEQKKIASFLSAVDKKIGHLTAKKELLEQYKKGVMQKIFSQEIRFTDDNGKDYPDWEKKPLAKIGEIVGGGTPDTSTSGYWNGKIQWFTPTEIQSKYITESKRKISKLGLNNSSARLLPAGTILFTSRATVAEASFAMKECTTNQGFQSIIVDAKNDSEFVYYLIKHYKKEFIRKAQGSTFLEISKNEMKKIKVIVPTLLEQKKIGLFLSQVDQKIATIQNQLTQTQIFKKGLLQQMFV